MLPQVLGRARTGGTPTPTHTGERRGIRNGDGMGSTRGWRCAHRTHRRWAVTAPGTASAPAAWVPPLSPSPGSRLRSSGRHPLRRSGPPGSETGRRAAGRRRPPRHRHRLRPLARRRVRRRRAHPDRTRWGYRPARTKVRAWGRAPRPSCPPSSSPPRTRWARPPRPDETPGPPTQPDRPPAPPPTAHRLLRERPAARRHGLRRGRTAHRRRRGFRPRHPGRPRLRLRQRRDRATQGHRDERVPRSCRARRRPPPGPPLRAASSGARTGWQDRKSEGHAGDTVD